MDAEALITPLYAALFGLMLAFLSAHVVILRRRKRISLHHEEDQELLRAIRAQGNFAEYVPLTLLLLLLIELNGAPRMMLWALGAFLLAGRVLHAFSLIVWEGKLRKRPYMWRVVGMICTFTVLVIASTYGIYQFYFGYHY